ncbi:hypothetical protein MMC20_002559 [Loxospora ochrophaea]|nr:hypothetical protein [Loxospora ochrophaea]
MHHPPSLRPLSSAFAIPLRSNPSPLLRTSSPQTSTPFSTSPSLLARDKGRQAPTDPRISLIRYYLQHPLTPRPLRLSRLRTLRHWTIHRAWLLHMRNQRRQEELELERQYNAMRAACEELRTGVGDGGRLFRQAVVKKGIFSAGVPVEYARAQVEGPSRDGWDHGWKRG